MLFDGWAALARARAVIFFRRRLRRKVTHQPEADMFPTTDTVHSTTTQKPPRPQNRELVSLSLRLLAGRDMSRRDFVAKLIDKGFTADEASQSADWCRAEGWLNEARFADGAARRLGQKYGASRVAQVLKQKGVGQEALEETVAQLKETDLARARALWQRRFGEPSMAANERAKQIRYLQTRGFSFAIIKKVLDGATDDE
jgi:regulatory protein